MANTVGRKGSVALVVALVVLIVLIAAGGVWYYAANKNATSQSIGVSTDQNVNSVATTTASVAATSTPSAQSPAQPITTPVVSQPSAAVPTGWGKGEFSFTAPITGCFAFNYPPAFSVSLSDNSSYYDQNGDTLKFWVNPGGFTQQMDEYAAEAGYSEKNFTTTSGLAGKEYVLKNNPTQFSQFYIVITVSSQQVLVNLAFDHISNMPPSSLDLGTEEAIARSIIPSCLSQ
jgi:beta-galactosidase/beta-glucuronidase